MPMSGAIFDCDGTIVDSMGMWRTVFDVMCERYGVASDPAFFGGIETLSLRDECRALHDEKHVGTSADDLYEEICAYVTDKYEHEIPTLPGCEAFSARCTRQASRWPSPPSTPAREVRRALEAHGLGDCFDVVVSTEDVGGRDKEYPDVYLEALRRLGTSRETTWVFEDAPLGCGRPSARAFTWWRSSTSTTGGTRRPSDPMPTSSSTAIPSSRSRSSVTSPILRPTWKASCMRWWSTGRRVRARPSSCARSPWLPTTS